MKIGHQFTRRGQRYRYLGTCPHITRDGRKVRLAVLESHCADCGAKFVYRTMPGSMNTGHYNRRCSLHKAPARRVRHIAPRAVANSASALRASGFDLAAALL